MVKTTLAGHGGDLCFIKGCVASTFDVPVGTSYAERGMRNDSHDALGLVLRLPVVSRIRGRQLMLLNLARSRKQAEDREDSERVAKICKWME